MKEIAVTAILTVAILSFLSWNIRSRTSKVAPLGPFQARTDNFDIIETRVEYENGIILLFDLHRNVIHEYHRSEVDGEIDTAGDSIFLFKLAGEMTVLEFAVIENSYYILGGDVRRVPIAAGVARDAWTKSFDGKKVLSLGTFSRDPRVDFSNADILEHSRRQLK